jgi:hypothetical protein
MGAHSDDRRQIAGNLPRRRLEGCDPTTHFWGMPCQHLDTTPPRIRLTGFVPDGFTALQVAQWELGDYTHVVVEAGLLRGCLLLQRGRLVDALVAARVTVSESQPPGTAEIVLAGEAAVTLIASTTVGPIKVELAGSVAPIPGYMGNVDARFSKILMEIAKGLDEATAVRLPALLVLDRGGAP